MATVTPVETSGTIVGTEEVLAEEAVTARPNPASTVIFLDYDLGTTPIGAEVEIVNALGQSVRRQRLGAVTAGTLEFATEGWNNGLYFVRLRTDDSRVAVRRVYVAK